MSGLSLAFGAPAVLLALFALPAIWWLLRLTPPRPRRQDFPPTALLRDLMPPDATPAHTPWWLLVLRLALALLVVLALAEPVWRPTAEIADRDGPLWLLVDDGWPAAEDWPAIRATAERALDQAAERGRSVLVAGTAGGTDQLFAPVSAEEARRRLAVLAPRPWADDRASLGPGLVRAAREIAPGRILWLAHGLDLSGDAEAFATELRRLAGSAPLALSRPARADVIGLAGLEDDGSALSVRVLRPADGEVSEGRVAAFDGKGRRLAESPFAFAPGETETHARFALPSEIRNDLARLDVVGHDSAGAVALIDERGRRRAVAVLAGTDFDRAQPLLAPTHYLDAALAPFADLRKARSGEIPAATAELLAGNPSVLIAADVGTFPPASAERIARWVEGGGTLVRFAGPRLGGGADPLLPVALRRGERTLGGALSWGRPRALGPFPEGSPFAGLAVPTDVTVSRQVLAEPAADLADHTWASLDDGTPLVTAARRGRGRIVLFHVGADVSWSNLPLSGVFVEMLRRIVALAAAPSTEAATAATDGVRPGAALPPFRLLDGFGRLGTASADARPIAAAEIDTTIASRLHPPGLWGNETVEIALPTLRPADRLAALPLDRLTAVDSVDRRVAEGPRPLGPALLVAALVLALVDALVMLGPTLRRLASRRVAMVLLAALALFAAPGVPRAESAADAFARTAATRTRLAYVLTGDPALDDISRRGLVGLGRALDDRTAVEPDEPIGVDPARDELAFFPLLYWPISAAQPTPSAAALGRLDAFMKHGGTVVFDTRDALEAAPLERTGRKTPAGAALARMLAGLDLPELEPVPADHVLGRTFYLLRDFPGRFDAGPLWVEASTPEGTAGEDRPARPGDGVSPVIVTGSDLAGAWAVDDGGGYLLPMSSSDPRGREMALRVGINIVMYVLTGNYKADQVHIPALLQRLGR